MKRVLKLSRPRPSNGHNAPQVSQNHSCCCSTSFSCTSHCIHLKHKAALISIFNGKLYRIDSKGHYDTEIETSEVDETSVRKGDNRYKGRVYASINTT